MKRITTAQLLMLMVTAFISVSGGGQDEPRNDVARPQSALTKAILQVRPSVVQIGIGFFHLPERTKKYLEKNSDWQGSFCPDPCAAFDQPMGTGFLVTEDGYVITAKHVMDALKKHPNLNDKRGPLEFGPASPTVRIQMPLDNEIGVNRAVMPPEPIYRGYFSGFRFEEIDEDPIHDLALLKLNPNPFTIDVDLKTPNGDVQKIVQVKPARLSLGRPDEGEPVAVSGYPLRSPVMVTTSGAIASSWEVDQKTFSSHVSDSYLADMHVNHGNSGGPVFSIVDGSVIGVCVSIVPDSLGSGYYNSGLSSIIPAKYVIELLKKHNLKWLSTGTSTRPD
jgi:S1-C subfamily serine protease